MNRPEDYDRLERRLAEAHAYLSTALGAALADAQPATRDLLLALAAAARRETTGKAMTTRDGLPGKQISDRFVRAGLPTLRTYLVECRLVYVAALLAVGTNHAQVAYALDWGTPQSMSRTVRRRTGVAVARFGETWTLESRTADVVGRYITPCLPILRGRRVLAGIVAAA